MPALWTIGYERLPPDALVAELEAAGAPRTALLCLEAEPAHCHRRVVAEQLRKRVPALRVVDL